MKKHLTFASISKTFLAVALFLLASAGLMAQRPGGMPGGMPGGGAPGGGQRQQMNIGRFYGKVVDEKGSGVAYATVQLSGMRFDTVSRSMKETLITGQITAENGDFSLEQIPIFGEFTLKVSFLGYADVEQKVSFGLSLGQGGRPDPAAMASMAAKVDKDLGNITLGLTSTVLKEVVVTGEAGSAQLALDKKIYRVDKNGVAAGGTAEDALKTLPSLSVDLDGNVTLRNASPQVFVDGRPTTLTLEQIPADAIESVEIITNPSAKYDASGGQGGIVNIVMKKDRRIGYNGSVRVGADSRGGINAGGDLNAREGKVNAFLGGFFNLRQGISEGETDRQNLFGSPLSNVFQRNDGTNTGFFGNGRAGIDWFMDNRNTLTFSGNYTRGQFGSDDLIGIYTDSLSTPVISTSSLRASEFERNFQNLGASILFKHLFPKAGMEWTADANYNSMRNGGDGNFNTSFSPSGIQSRERQETEGGSSFITLQTDFVNPITDKIKLEFGARAAIRNFNSDQFNFVYNFADAEWIPVVNFADQYKFNDQVYAAYGTFSHSFKKWGYQLGLRVESSAYTGELLRTREEFTNNFPLSFFPSVFVTRKLNEEDNIQLSLSRRINRPNFFQLIPFTDYTDSLNLQRGNPDLLPEFSTAAEVSYQKIFKKGHNLLVSAYYRRSDDLITAYQFSEFNDVINRNVVVSSFANSNFSEAYGVEFTLRNTFKDKIELTTNINVYNSKVDASNVETNLVNEQLTWFLKENLSIRLPASITFQINAEYRSRAAFSPSMGGGGRGGRGGGPGGGGGFFGGPTSTAQGYTRAIWFVDMALRKDLFNRKASITLNMQDVFRTRRMGTFTESAFFIQDSWRIRDPQTARLNFSYRFGKMDVSLFRRKNTNINSDGAEMMQ